MIKAIEFNLGDMLIDYKDVPLRWEQFYEDGLKIVLMIQKQV